VDYAAALYGPIYAVIGVPAVLTVSDSDLALTAIDKTAGIGDGSAVEIETVVPGAVVRAAELADQGIGPDDVDGATIAFNGGTWTIRAHRSIPAPTGESLGEILLMLSEIVPS
jgi:hypothetical protein